MTARCEPWYAILGSALVSEEFARCLRTRTAGVPFAVEELIRLLCDRDRFALAAGGRPIADVEQAKLGVDSRHALAGPEAARALGDADTPGG
jgi:hypothetical protein